MNAIHALLFRLGIPTYHTSILTTTAADMTIKIASEMPSNIGRIYGISIDTDGKQPDDNSKSLITFANTLNLYLTFKKGSTVFLENMRLDALVFTKTGGSADNPARYYPVNIPGDFDLDKSVYMNPTAIAAGAIIKLNLLYVPTKAYQYMLEQKVVGNIDWMGLEA